MPTLCMSLTETKELVSLVACLLPPKKQFTIYQFGECSCWMQNIYSCHVPWMPAQKVLYAFCLAFTSPGCSLVALYILICNDRCLISDAHCLAFALSGAFFLAAMGGVHSQNGHRKLLQYLSSSLLSLNSCSAFSLACA